MQVLFTSLTIQLKFFVKNMVIVLLITATYHLRILNNQAQVTKKGSVDSGITNAKIGLTKLNIQFPTKLIIAHLNINSIRNKPDSLSFVVENNADILLTSETKLDD